MVQLHQPSKDSRPFKLMGWMEYNHWLEMMLEQTKMAALQFGSTFHHYCCLFSDDGKGFPVSRLMVSASLKKPDIARIPKPQIWMLSRQTYRAR